MAHVAGYKKKVVEEFVDLMNEYPIIGAVNMENMPAPQLQKMRALFRGSVVIRMSKRRLIKIAIDKAKDKKKDLEKITEHLRGMPALLFTKENPFKLYKTIRQNKSKAPAKGGQIAPNDIWIRAGPTSFAPGPVIGELGSIGLKTGVENGKVAIKQDKVVVKEGEAINQNVAGMLTRLGIEPMEIGLDLVAAYENGVIFTKNVLSIDEVKFYNDLQNAARWAFNLSVEAAYPVKENIRLLIGKSFKEAKFLALEQNIMCDAVAEELVAKAERQMLALKNTAHIEVTVKPKVEKKKDQSKVEEKPREEARPEAPKGEVKAEEQKEEPKVEGKVGDIDVQKEVTEEEIAKRMHDHAQELNKELKDDEEKIKEEVKELPVTEKKEVKKEVEEVDGLAKDLLETEKVLEEDKVEKIVSSFKPKERDKKPTATELLGDVKKPEEAKADIDDSEKLFEQLKQKGTLRGIKPEKKKSRATLKMERSSPPTADELIKMAKSQKKAYLDKVPTAHELAEKLKKKQKL